ncbi:MAG TPA: hypothetical protein VGR69_11195 [Candidatus Rubrimentiphilum sp.]|nr:hypothetical protein [Candidatus Rubrimentiphilum sp.]
MEREHESNEDLAEREIEEEKIYGDTDMDPNRDDQRDAHRAEPDEHV